MSKKKNDETSFVFYRSFYDAVNLIPDEATRCRAYTALCEYAFCGTEPAEDADVLVKMVFAQAKPQLDANAKRRENGRAGGRKAKNQLEAESETQTERKAEAKLEPETKTETETDGFANENQCSMIVKPNVNVNVNANANANANVNENVNDNENDNANQNVNENANETVTEKADKNDHTSAGQTAAARVISDGQTHFTPPTHTQVMEYLAEKELDIDAERFIDYYTSNGWMVGKNRMRDWKAAVRSWARQDERYQGGSRNTGNQKGSQNGTQSGRRNQKGAEHDGKMEPQFGLCL